MTTATTNDNPTALSAPRLRSVRPLSLPELRRRHASGLCWPGAGAAGFAPAPRRRRTRQPRRCSAAAWSRSLRRPRRLRCAAWHRPRAPRAPRARPAPAAASAARRRTSRAGAGSGAIRRPCISPPQPRVKQRCGQRHGRSAPPRAPPAMPCTRVVAASSTHDNSFGAPTSLTGPTVSAHTQVKPRECPRDATPGPTACGVGTMRLPVRRAPCRHVSRWRPRARQRHKPPSDRCSSACSAREAPPCPASGPTRSSSAKTAARWRFFAPPAPRSRLTSPSSSTTARRPRRTSPTCGPRSRRSPSG